MCVTPSLDLSDTFVYDSGDTRFAVEENGGLVEDRTSNCGELHRYSGDMWTTGELAGKYIMDRNVGALDTAYAWTSNGGKGSLYYQFGRKDPFPAATTTSGTVSAAWNSSGSTWTITSSPYYQASTASTMATTVQNPMNHYYNSSTYSYTNAKYPTCGYRTYTAAALTLVGSYGYCWSSTPGSTTHGYNFNFGSGTVSPATSYQRSSGFSVRAVQE